MLDTRQYRTDQPCGDQFGPRCPGAFKADFDNPASATIGTEFVGTSISSSFGDGADTNALVALAVPSTLPTKFFDGLNRGYVRCTVTPDIWQTDYRLDLSDTTAPVVALSAIDGVVTSPTDIIGTVDNDNLVSYTLSLAALGTDNFREIYRGTNTVDDAVLGQLDTSLFQNDAYTLRLTAEDAGDNSVFVDETINIGGDLKLGNFTLSFMDMELPVSGIPVAVTRTYDSLTANEIDDFGYGWRLEFRDTNLRNSLGRDEQYENFGIRSQAFDEETRVYITLPGSQRQSFTFAPERAFISNYLPPVDGFDTSFYTATFKADDGVISTLSVKYDGYLTRCPDNSFGAFQGSGFNPADPVFGGVYVLTTKEGIGYEIDANTGDLLTAKDLNGNTVTFDDKGIYSDDTVGECQL